MSGPWDRQPSPEPDDEWPSEDLGRRDPWSTADPSRDAAHDSGPGWDDWPAPPPPADDYLIEEPLAPSSDPWAESWTDEASAGPAPTWSGERADAAGPRVEPWSPDADPWGLPAADVSWQEPARQAREAAPAAPIDETPIEAPVETPPPARVEHAPLETIPVEADAPAPPQVAWSPPANVDWSGADEIETDTDEPIRDEPTTAEPVAREAFEAPAWPGEPPSIFASPEPEPEPETRRRWFAPAEAPEEAVDAGWRESIFPTAEPGYPVDAGSDLEPQAAPEPIVPDASASVDEAAPVVEAERAPGTTDSVEAEPVAEAVPVVEAAPAIEAGPVSEPEPQPEAPSRFNPLRWLAGRGGATPDVEAEPTVEPTVVGEAESVDAQPVDAQPVDAQSAPAPDATLERPESATPLPEDAWEPDAALEWQPAAEPEPEPRAVMADDGWTSAWPEADVVEPQLEPTDGQPQVDEGAIGPSEPAWPEPEWRSEPAWGSAAAVAPPALEEPEQFAPASTTEPQPEPEPAWTPEPESEPESELEPAWSSEPRWPEASESTQVLPSSWTPPVPAPRPAEPSLAPTAGEIRTRLAQAEADEDAEPATSTAEQAVPWLIGVILLLAGMVIVLLALIFAGDASLAGGGSEPSGSAVAVADPGGSGEPVATPSATPVATRTPAASASAAPSSTPVAMPDYGPLEMVYQGRSAALAAIYLLHRDFTTEDEPEVLAQDATLDVRRFAWSPDGRHGAGLLADVLVSIEPGADKRRLGDGIDTIVFGADPATLYAVRVTQDGANDVAAVLAIDFTSGDTTELASVTYARPSLEDEAAVNEAQFADDGGAVRLYWMHDGTLRLWALGAGSWEIDPEAGEATELETDDVPWLWDSDGRHRITYTASEGTTTLSLLDRSGGGQATTTVDGLVSHLRWSPDGKRVVFTVGRSTAGGGVLQDLFLWDLGDGEAPVQITNTGAAFGAQWLGTMDRFQDATPDA